MGTSPPSSLERMALSIQDQDLGDGRLRVWLRDDKWVVAERVLDMDHAADVKVLRYAQREFPIGTSVLPLDPGSSRFANQEV
jgi:hypothetical protein